MRLGKRASNVLIALLISAVFAFCSVARPAQASIAVVAEIEGPIGPSAVRYVANAVDLARERQANALILQINTPGGLETSMREIIAHILSSPVAVIGYVAPPGARAASAGTYIMYATSLAAMAPGTNLGAATPIQIGGTPTLPKFPSGDDKKDGQSSDKKASEGNAEDAKPAPMPEKPGELKAINDAVAFIRSLAELHGRNADWAEKAVREAASLSAKAALEQGVIDLIATDIGELLTAADGRIVIVAGKEQQLSTKSLSLERLEPDTLTKLLGIISNPNVALLLMLIGVYGLIFEFANPGTIGPGIIGAICLLLGLYALNQLPLDYTGFALLLLGLAFMVAEAFTPTFGVLGVGGLIAFVIGATMLVDTDVPAFQPSWTVIGFTAALSGATLTLLLGYVWRSFRRPVVTGVSGLRGSHAEIIDWSGGEGHVWAQGERWNAVGTGPFRAGDNVRIESVEGLTLVVRGAENDEMHP
jgi:membrane-bound serine protease (ClpP class)